MKYAITSTSHVRWEPCAATTLNSAKRLATTEYGAGPNDDTISVGEMYGEGKHLRIFTMAEKPNRPGGKWENTRES